MMTAIEALKIVKEWLNGFRKYDGTVWLALQILKA